MNLSDISILNIKGADYCCIISGIELAQWDNKSNAKINLTKKSGTL